MNKQAYDEFDLMAEGDENSTLGASFPKLNFGKCAISNKFFKWEDKVSEEITPAQFVKLDPKGRSQEMTLAIDIQEFNPNLQFTYARKINVGGLDWNKIFKPSLLKALGIAPSEDKKESAKQISEAVRKLQSAYLCVEDVPAHASKAERAQGLKFSEKYNTAKIVTLYPDRASAYSAWKSTYGKAASNGEGEVADAGPAFESGFPEGYTSTSWAEQKEAFTSAYNSHVKTLTKGTVPQKRTIALAYVAENEAGSTPEQLAELIGV